MSLESFVAKVGVDLVFGCVVLDRWRRKLSGLVFELMAKLM